MIGVAKRTCTSHRPARLVPVAASCGGHLEANLQSLIERLKANRYRAPAVRRVHIPKAGRRDETRPLGIPSFEDKLLLRPVVMLLEAAVAFRRPRQVPAGPGLP